MMEITEMIEAMPMIMPSSVSGKQFCGIYDVKPAKKDSTNFLRPKEVTLSAAVEPAEARPGDTVTYRLTAKVKPPYHIYTYAREQPAEGPRNTTPTTSA